MTTDGETGDFKFSYCFQKEKEIRKDRADTLASENKFFADSLTGLNEINFCNDNKNLLL